MIPCVFSLFCFTGLICTLSFQCLSTYFGFHFPGVLPVIYCAGEGEEKELEPEKEPDLIVRDDSWRKNAPVREWDKHKTPLIFGKLPKSIVPF